MAVEGVAAPSASSPASTARPYVVLAIADPDPATKRLSVTLSGIDAVGSFTLPRSYRIV